MEFQKFVDTYSWEWVIHCLSQQDFKGVDVEKLLIKDIQLNSELQDVLSAVAKEQRQAQSKLINA
jgi:regulator of protease activity HflC (stomatin/prohibitin superfamily)